MIQPFIFYVIQSEAKNLNAYTLWISLMYSDSSSLRSSE